MLHRARHLLVRQRTAQVSAMRAHLAEYGIMAPKGQRSCPRICRRSRRGDAVLPDLARQTLLLIAQMIEGLSQQIRKIEIELMAWHRAKPRASGWRPSPVSGSSPPPRRGRHRRRRRHVPFRSPVRRLARTGAQAAFLRRQGADGWDIEDGRSLSAPPPRRRRNRGRPLHKSQANAVSIWANRLLERKPARLVTVAVANKMARIAWAVMARKENYRGSGRSTA